MPMVQRKQDAAEIKGFMERLQRLHSSLADGRRWWPRFVYHHTDVLTRAECSFSDGGLNRPGTRTYSRTDELRALHLCHPLMAG